MRIPLYKSGWKRCLKYFLTNVDHPKESVGLPSPLLSDWNERTENINIAHKQISRESFGTNPNEFEIKRLLDFRFKNFGASCLDFKNSLVTFPYKNIYDFY